MKRSDAIGDVLIDSASVRDAVEQFTDMTPVMSRQVAGMHVWLKCENLQRTGSFKVRGAAAALGALARDVKARGVVACSSGNHGRAVAYVAKSMGVPATICVPQWIDPQKLTAIKLNEAQVVADGKTYDESEAEAIRLAQERSLAFVGPFDDLNVIAGQGTLGLELLDQIENLRTVVIPVSGGGLAAGVAHALKSRKADIEVVGVSASSARVMLASLQVGRPVTLPETETLATALAGGIGQQNRYTLQAVQSLVDRHVEVSEEEIADAIRFAAGELKLVIEGGGAVGLAALLARKLGTLEQPCCIVLSGGNIDPKALASVLA